MTEFERNGIFTLDSKGNFKSFDAEKILGYREDELIGKRFTKLLPKKFLPAALELFQRAIKSKSSAAEIEFYNREGKLVGAEMSSIALRERGKITGFKCVVKKVRKNENNGCG